MHLSELVFLELGLERVVLVLLIENLVNLGFLPLDFLLDSFGLFVVLGLNSFIDNNPVFPQLVPDLINQIDSIFIVVSILIFFLLNCLFFLSNQFRYSFFNVCFIFLINCVLVYL